MKVTKLSQLGINPFEQTLVIYVKQRDTKEPVPVEDITLFATSEIEHQRYTKVYYSLQNRDDKVALPLRSKEMLLWLYDSIRAGTDLVYIDKAAYMATMDIKEDTYKTALDGLIANCFLQMTIKRGYYWINPKYFFRGSRINKYPERLYDTAGHKVKRTKKPKTQKQIDKELEEQDKWITENFFKKTDHDPFSRSV